MQIYADEHADVRLQGFYPGKKIWLTLVKMLSCFLKGKFLNTSYCEAGRLQGACAEHQAAHRVHALSTRSQSQACLTLWPVSVCFIPWGTVPCRRS